MFTLAIFLNPPAYFPVSLCVYKQKATSLPCTLKTEFPQPEVIQDLWTVCHDALPSVPKEELPHSGNLQIRGLMSIGNDPA